MTRVGDDVWIFNHNIRVYSRPNTIDGGGIVRRACWEKHKVTGETSRSWLVGEPRRKLKVPKKGPWREVAWSEQEIDEKEWVEANRYNIGNEVGRRCEDYAKLRQIADIIGYVEKPKP